MIADRLALPYAEPVTAALRLALSGAALRGVDDLLFLERWEIAPVAGPADVLRAAQVRRANPELAAAIRAELASRGKRG